MGAKLCAMDTITTSTPHSPASTAIHWLDAGAVGILFICCLCCAENVGAKLLAGDLPFRQCLDGAAPVGRDLTLFPLLDCLGAAAPARGKADLPGELGLGSEQGNGLFEVGGRALAGGLIHPASLNLWFRCLSTCSCFRGFCPPVKLQPMVDAHSHDGDRLAALMQRAGITDAVLAEATGRSIQAVGKWRKTGKFAREHISLICATVHCTSDELLGLVPIGAAGSPTRSAIAVDRERMKNAIEWTTEGLLESTTRSPSATAELVLAVHDMLAESEDQVSRSVVLQLVRRTA